MWPSYLINLNKNKDRLENSRAQFLAQNIPFERIEAVNGWELPEARIAEVYDAEANRTKARAPLVRPEIGCYLSHVEAWRRIAEAGAEGGFIFEDDFLAAPELGDVLGALSGSAEDWDMVKLFTFDPGAEVVSERPLNDRHRLVEPYKVPTCLIGYGLTRKAAQKLCARSARFFRPVDEDMKYFWETGLKVALVLPAPITIGEQDTVTGTIGAERRRLKPSSIIWKIRGLLYSLSYQRQLKRARRAR